MSVFDDYSNAEWILDELNSARCLVVGMAPRDIRSILRTEAKVATIHELVVWDSRVVDALLEAITPGDARFRTAFDDSRVYCPACGGSLNAFADGFAFPHGLRQHLSGSGNAARCRVVHHAREVARFRLFSHGVL